MFRKYDRIYGVFALIVLFAIFERVYMLGDRGFWYDELFTVLSASERSLQDVFNQWLLADMHPPLHNLALYAWFKAVPNHELWARLPSALAGIAILPIVYYMTKDLLNRAGRLYALAIVAMSHLCVFYSQEARSYIFVIALGFSLHLLWANVLFVRKKLAKPQLAACLILSLALAYTHYFGLFYAMLLFAVVLASDRFRIISAKQTLVFLGIFGLSYLPGFMMLAHSISIRIANKQEQFNRILAVPKFLNHFLFDDRWLLLALGLWVGYLGYANRSAIRLPSSHASRFDVAVMLALVTAFFVGSFVTPTLQFRYMAIWVPAATLILARTLSHLLREKDLVVVATLVLALQIFHFTKYRKYTKQQWDVATRIALSTSRHSQPVFILGTDSDKTALDYLKSNDIFGFFYCRMAQFFGYYFERQSQAAPELVKVSDEVASLTKIARIMRTQRLANTTLLAGHHLALSEQALDTLRSSGIQVTMQQLASTKVYTLSMR